MYQRKNYYLYVLSSKRNGTLYIGVTNSLVRRIYEHKHGLVDGFTKKYSVHDLVYYETYDSINTAISREKEVKKWRRKDKINLIEKENPNWRDLYEELSPV
ncbi:MAG: hypothetical protein A2534_01630 [Candidatus Magasanikbacteria bacterium RIFOXYD2_FULL_39_9]|uniref:GIY-YIG domain-containing protein n=1 Tax=Candidatus Magasanikbacteria bacterium RIFOXYD1_FULL_40_23 TaxID=1798705 RepID=A0A1F6PA37_9BACT|nr:MAG: hypothetical protein A2563_04615 [Candidatus Magasanikbacteria bacterium RIFOXYD1_FULL_40_23]OGH93577.1 MAG: hypothetical protein A2534_01630 [Candidatus Magasanikbacteria bacterium RIFOXYD2_FULL_39_9]